MKVEFWPGGEPDRARVVGQVAVAQTRATPDRADYAALAHEILTRISTLEAAQESTEAMA